MKTFVVNGASVGVIAIIVALFASMGGFIFGIYRFLSNLLFLTWSHGSKRISYWTDFRLPFSYLISFSASRHVHSTDQQDCNSCEFRIVRTGLPPTGCELSSCFFYLVHYRRYSLRTRVCVRRLQPTRRVRGFVLPLFVGISRPPFV